MKKLYSWLWLLMAAVVATTTTSCLSDDDDDNQEVMDQATYQRYLTEMAGSYTGKTYYFNIEGNGYKADSVAVTAQILGVGDSLINISGIPAKLLARCVGDSAIYKAVVGQPDQRLQMKFYIGAFHQGIVQFGIYPLSVTFDDLEYNGAEHDVVFNFVLYRNILGAYSNGVAELTYYLMDLWEDGRQKETYYSLYDTSGYSNTRYMFLSVLNKRKDTWNNH